MLVIFKILPFSGPDCEKRDQWRKDLVHKINGNSAVDKKYM
jgi:hypothetical protein